MNIKEKIVEQVTFLEKIQERANGSVEYGNAVSASKLIMDYIVLYDEVDDSDYICPDCEERELREHLNQEIADACDMPIEIVRRVLAGQREVLGMDN